MKKNKKLSWKCCFTEHNNLCLRELYVTASSIVDVFNKLHEDLSKDFIRSHLLEVSFYTVYYE